MYQVRVASKEEFLHSHQQWNDLVLKMKRPSIFFTWEWINAWWEHFGNPYEPFILNVFNGSDLVAILPLCVRTMAIQGALVPARVVSFCSSVELAPDHMDIICDEQHSEGSLQAIFDFLTALGSGWDAIHFSHLSDEGHLMQWLRKSAASWEIKQVTVAPFIALEGGTEKYLERFTKKHRRNMNRLRGRLEREYRVQYQAIDGSSPQEAEACLKELFRLHHSRKEQTGIKSAFRGQAIEDFHLGLARTIGPMKWLRLASFGIGDTCIAVAYGFNLAGSLMYYQSGFDPEWERHSVGSLLILEFIQDACKEGCREFDFLRGDEEYKNVWTDRRRPLFDASFYNQTVRGGLVKSLARARSFVAKIRN